MTDSEPAWFDANRALWDERTPIHVASRFYDVDGFKAGRDTIRGFESAEVGAVAGKDLVHLQCHFGLDALSWARRGARVTGLDFSEPAITAARAIAAEVRVDATFVVANVYDAAEALGGATFDVVYTGLGALNWLPDIDRWASVAAGLVRPGGFLYLAEFHPISWVFGDDDLTFDLSYFDTEPYLDDTPGTYADLQAPTEHNASYESQHTLGDVVSAIAANGLRIEMLHEHDHTLFARWPFLELSDSDTYRFPPDRPSLPLMYSLRASRP